MARYTIAAYSLKALFSRMGDGVLPTDLQVPRRQVLLKIAHERVSIKEAVQAHLPQDAGRGSGGAARVRSRGRSLRSWIETHCLPHDRRSVPRAANPVAWPGWSAVGSEASRFMAGLQLYSRVTYTDFPTNHETRDWNWDQVPDPPFMYMLTDVQTGLAQGHPKRPSIHHEWETGSMPLPFRPFWGEYVTQWGRHIHDMGHPPLKSEIHPAHTMVRQRTAAVKWTAQDKWLPSNKAVIGMGLSGGFPGDTHRRWQLEFGDTDWEDDIGADQQTCWPTNLVQHPARFVLHPPVPRPHPDARLLFFTTFCELIQVADMSGVNDWLDLCQRDSPDDGGRGLAARVWSRARSLPQGFPPVALSNTDGAWPQHRVIDDADGKPCGVQVTIAMNGIVGVPVAYLAHVHCAWDRPSPDGETASGEYLLQRYRVTFATLHVLETDEWWDDWHFYYGVNGEWGGWWTDDHVVEGHDYSLETAFEVATVGDQPLLIRDAGVEWDGFDFSNEKLDRVELDLDGPDHFAALDALARTDGATILDQGADYRRIRVKSTSSGDTRHEWTLFIQKLAL